MSGTGEVLEAHDAALRELLQSMQRVEEQQAELAELQVCGCGCGWVLLCVLCI